MPYYPSHLCLITAEIDYSPLEPKVVNNDDGWMSFLDICQVKQVCVKGPGTGSCTDENPTVAHCLPLCLEEVFVL